MNIDSGLDNNNHSPEITYFWNVESNLQTYISILSMYIIINRKYKGQIMTAMDI